MAELIKKNSKETIQNRVSFPTTDDMKKKIDALKKHYDINEMFRQYADKLIEKAEKEPA